MQGDNGHKITMQRYRAVCTRFVIRAVELLNTKVARNPSRFGDFHDLLYTFALAEESDVQPIYQTQASSQQEVTGSRGRNDFDAKAPGARVGLEFFFKIRFVEKACDFLLGKKSPLCRSNESRADVGGGYTQPPFGQLIKLVATMITDEHLLAKYPMTGIEKEMLLHHHLLKLMLGSASAGKQFGQCLAGMCRDNAKLSKRVTKVFLRSIEQAGSDFSAVRSYLKALKPFLRSDDSLKHQKLEWVFGIPEVMSRKMYGESRCKYGLELIDRMNEESMTFTSPILYGTADEALIAQIIKSKGSRGSDLQCASCLKELLSLMRKDHDVAHFVYHLPPNTYWNARFTDWFGPYLQREKELGDSSKYGNSNHSQSQRNRQELILKALAHLEALAPVFAEFERA